MIKVITYEANFIKLYEITVQNNLPGYGNSGIITVELSSENSPYYFDVEETKDFTASGITQTIDNVQFTFDEWYKNGSPTQETSPFEPSGNDTYTAKYNAKPLGWTRQIQCTSNIGQPIRITWNDHPSENVTSYQIWCKAGSSGTPSNEGSVNRNVETWTDPDYTRTGSTLDPLLQYDVRPYYAPTSTYGDSNFVNVAYGFIEETVQQADAGSHATVAEEISPNYFIGSYPNPFNPQTTIKYNLPAAGFVSLKVYNSIGKEVAELVNGVKEEGSYSVDFDGTDLASGIYIYSIRVNDFIQSGKMLLVK